MDPVDLAALRRDYTARGLRRGDLDPSPLRQFAKWLAEAIVAEPADPNAMTLSTVTAEGQPTSRIVLLKELTAQGFVFFTNYQSAKGQHLAANPRAALSFFWPKLERQVGVAGHVVKVSVEASRKYFASRPRGSQLGAWASAQSKVIETRGWLEERLREVTARFGDAPIPLPEHWGGFCLEPVTVEFWQGRSNRLHDRLRYVKDGDGWRIERLSP